MALRVAFFGTPGFAVPTLEHLVHSPASGRRRDHATGQAARPRPADRGRPVKSLASALRLPVLQPASSPAISSSALAALDADIGVVAAYGKILPDWLLATPRLG
jgi:methionyl-tRNA formyltransferase